MPRVLIVEDDADQRKALILRLNHEGYETSVAQDAPTAVRLARLHRPDAIVLDLGLPGGDGYVVMSRLRSIPELACIPILVLSAREANTEQSRALEEGAVAYYQKPIRNNSLRMALKAVIARRHSARGPGHRPA